MMSKISARQSYKEVISIQKYLYTSLFIILANCICINLAIAQSDSTHYSNDTDIKKDPPRITNTSVSGDTLPQITKTVPHIYRVNGWFSGTFSLVVTAADIYAIPNIIKSKKPLSDLELEALNRSAIPVFD